MLPNVAQFESSTTALLYFDINDELVVQYEQNRDGVSVPGVRHDTYLQVHSVIVLIDGKL